MGKTSITSSPKWLITLTAMRPVAAFGNGRETALCRDSRASLTFWVELPAVPGIGVWGIEDRLLEEAAKPYLTLKLRCATERQKVFSGAREFSRFAVIARCGEVQRLTGDSEGFLVTGELLDLLQLPN